MKLSRRGKQARRGRHTKRAGKHLRYKSKKFSGSKRYHRGNKRTYKRGKRFHRGGEERVDGGKIDKKKPGVVIDLSNTTNITDADITETNIAFYPEGYKKWFTTRNSMYYGNVMDRGNSDRQGGYEFTFNSLNSGAYVIQFNNVPLVFTKEGFFTGTKAPGKFKVVIIEEKPFEDPNDTRTKALRKFRAILIRQDENIGKYDNDGFSLEVHFRNLESNNLNDFKSMLINTTNLQKLESNHDKKYNFNYTENIKYFELFSKAADVLSAYVEAQFMAQQNIIQGQQRIRDERERELTQIKSENNQKAENGIGKIVKTIQQLGDDFTVDPYMSDRQKSLGKINFGQVKNQLIQFANTEKTRIDNTAIDANTKVNLKKQIDELLLLLLLAQFMYMKILNIKYELARAEYGFHFIDDHIMIKIENDLSTLTNDTKKFIQRLGATQKQDYAYANLQSSLNQFIDSCVIKNPTSDESNEASLALDKEQKDKLIQEISAPPPAAPAAAPAADTDEQIVTTGQHSVPGHVDASLPPRVNTSISNTSKPNAFS